MAARPGAWAAVLAATGRFEADDLRTHVAELFPDGLSQHGWQYMVERHDFIRPTNSDTLFVNHNMVVELVFEYVRRAVFPSRGSRLAKATSCQSMRTIEVKGAVPGDVLEVRIPRHQSHPRLGLQSPSAPIQARCFRRPMQWRPIRAAFASSRQR